MRSPAAGTVPRGEPAHGWFSRGRVLRVPPQGALARESLPASGASYASDLQRVELKMLFRRYGARPPAAPVGAPCAARDQESGARRLPPLRQALWGCDCGSPTAKQSSVWREPRAIRAAGMLSDRRSVSRNSLLHGFLSEARELAGTTQEVRRGPWQQRRWRRPLEWLGRRQRWCSTRAQGRCGRAE